MPDDYDDEYEPDAFAEDDDPLCRCGHEKDDHSPARGNMCDLSFACRCTGYEPVTDD